MKGPSPAGAAPLGLTGAPNFKFLPAPDYRDEQTRALGEQLEAATERRERLQEAGGDIAAVTSEILGIRRKLRLGGRLNEGDFFADDRYLILKKLGSGGFATVWKARNRATGEDVAIKVLHSDVSGDPTRRERFFRGARVMSTLTDDAIVRIVDPGGEDEGYYYFVMQCITGDDLHQAVLKRRLTNREMILEPIPVGPQLAR